MAKARMLAGGIVDPGAGAPGAVTAFVAVSGGATGSRLFKVEGPTSAPSIVELPAATTVDLGRFDRDARLELEPALRGIKALGGNASIARPSAAWVCSCVRAHLLATEGLAVD